LPPRKSEPAAVRGRARGRQARAQQGPDNFGGTESNARAARGRGGTRRHTSDICRRFREPTRDQRPIADGAVTELAIADLMARDEFCRTVV
jgi:hypothetical protein